MLEIGLYVLVAVVVVSVPWLWMAGDQVLLQGHAKRSDQTGPRPKGLLDLDRLRKLVLGPWADRYKIKVAIHHLVPRLGPRGKKWLANRYHSKVLTPELAKAVVTVDRDISLRDLEQVIPYEMARDIVLQASPDLAVQECDCRNARQNPCQPTQVCMIIGQPFVNFVLEHYPSRTRRISREEAEELLHSEHERGHVHTAWFKKSKLNRFYAICNCCPCCCGGIEAMVKHGIPILASSGFVAEVDAASCTGCGECASACSFGAISQDGDVRVDREVCMGCGVCVGQCQVGAVRLVRDERKGEPLDVRLLD